MQSRYGERRVVVGHDFRSYSQECCRSLILGVLTSGAGVIDVGLVTTPQSISRSTVSTSRPPP